MMMTSDRTVSDEKTSLKTEKKHLKNKPEQRPQSLQSCCRNTDAETGSCMENLLAKNMVMDFRRTNRALFKNQ